MIATLDADGDGSLDPAELDRAIREHRIHRKKARAGDPNSLAALGLDLEVHAAP